MLILLRWLAPFERSSNKKEAKRVTLSLPHPINSIDCFTLAKCLDSSLRTAQNECVDIVGAFIGIHRF